MNELFALASSALAAAEVDEKLTLIARLARECGRQPVPLPSTFVWGQDCPERGVLAGVAVVSPKQVATRNAATPEGRAGLLHAIAHIEYTAIDLALDHALRFSEMPAAYYMDWCQVAVEEAHHFSLLRDRLQSLGRDYGDFPVHASLWRMAELTRTDVLERMALVPRLLEARGLDATPPLRDKLAKAGDHASVAALEVILRDEVGHVGLGDRWFRHLCAQRGLPPEETYRDLIRRFAAPWPQQPLNREARRQAGFTDMELDRLTAGPRGH